MNSPFEQTDIFEELMQAIRPRKYLGKYRGTVANNQDPERRGRIQAIVPALSKDTPTTWALPSVPFAYMNTGMFVLPPKDAGVWIEFEQGNPDYPIWTGGYWSDGQMPMSPTNDKAMPNKPNVVIQNGDNTFLIHGAPGAGNGIILSAGPHNGASSPKIEITKDGIKLTVGQSVGIEITSSGVTINKGALKVLP